MSDDPGQTDEIPVSRDRHAAPRRYGIPPIVAVLAVVAALGLGLVVGWASRGERPPASLVTEELELPVVTVTVER